MVDTNGFVEIKDFELNPQPKRFKLYQGDDFIFEAPPSLPLYAMADASKLQAAGFSPETIPLIIEFFTNILLPESATEFRKRATAAHRFPIGIDTLPLLMNWFLEAYGLRPTQPSSDSSSTSEVGDGTSSTAGVPSTESTQPGSQLLVS